MFRVDHVGSIGVVLPNKLTGTTFVGDRDALDFLTVGITAAIKVGDSSNESFGIGDRVAKECAGGS